MSLVSRTRFTGWHCLQLATALLVFLVSPLPLAWLALPVLLIAVPAVINFTNVMDGLDGLVAGCMAAAISALAMALSAPWPIWALVHSPPAGVLWPEVSRMPLPLRRCSLVSGLGLASVICGLDRQGWITFFAAILLALITLFAGRLFPADSPHVSILGAASVDLPQQAGIPCIAAAVAAAIEQ